MRALQRPPAVSHGPPQPDKAKVVCPSIALEPSVLKSSLLNRGSDLKVGRRQPPRMFGADGLHTMRCGRDAAEDATPTTVPCYRPESLPLACSPRPPSLDAHL